MLLGLTIRDVVLIDRLSLAFHPGLCVLTGETGAGKSILLDALGLALGRRAEAGLVRAGTKEAAVSAEFAVGRNHPAHAILSEAGLDGDGETIVRAACSRPTAAAALLSTMRRRVSGCCVSWATALSRFRASSSNVGCSILPTTV